MEQEKNEEKAEEENEADYWRETYNEPSLITMHCTLRDHVCSECSRKLAMNNGTSIQEATKISLSPFQKHYSSTKPAHNQLITLIFYPHLLTCSNTGRTSLTVLSGHKA